MASILRFGYVYIEIDKHILYKILVERNYIELLFRNSSRVIEDDQAAQS